MVPSKTGQRPPIIGSFEDIGKDVASETAKVPMEIAGKIIESLTGGSATSGKQGQQTQQKTDGALGQMEETKDRQLKKAIARAALQQLAEPAKKEPTDFEKKTRDESERKDMEKKQKEQAAFEELPKMTAKKRRGDLYGIQGKASSEKSRNVRQD